MTYCVFLSQTKMENYIFDYRYETQPELVKVKKINAGAKRDLLNSVIKTDEKDDPSLDETNVTGLRNLINVIKRYENIIKQRGRRLLNCYTSKEKY